MVDSQITILGFGWTKSIANSASASKADMLGWCSYVLFMGASLPPFLLLCSKKIMHKILSLCYPHTFVFWWYKPIQCAGQIPWFSYNLIIEQRGTHIIRNIFPDGQQKALFIVTKHQKTELSKLGWLCCSHCGFFKCTCTL